MKDKDGYAGRKSRTKLLFLLPVVFIAALFIAFGTSKTDAYAATATVSIPVRASWVEEDGTPAETPQSGYVTVVCDGGYDDETYEEYYYEGTLSANNNWTVSFDGLPKYDSSGYKIDYNCYIYEEYDEYGADVPGFLRGSFNKDSDGGYTYTARRNTPVTIPIRASWVDEDGNAVEAPQSGSVTVECYGGYDEWGEEIYYTRTLSAPDWTASFDDMPKYDADGYTINYSCWIEEVDGEYSADVPGFLRGSFNKDSDGGYTYTARRNTPVNIPIRASWVDDDGNTVEAPQSGSVTVTCYGGWDEEAYEDIYYTRTISAPDWTATFDDLPKYDSYGDVINYSCWIEEGDADVPGFFAGTFTRDDDGGYTYTALKKELISIPVTASWVDGDGVTQVAAPSQGSVEIGLEYYGDYGWESDYKTISAPDWTVSFDNLDKYDQYGDIIDYDVYLCNEDVPGFFDSELKQNDDGSYTYSAKKYSTISIPLTMNWLASDGKSKAAAPGEGSALFYVNGDGTRYEITLSAPEWSGSIDNLPKFDDYGNLIEYEAEFGWLGAPGFVEGALAGNVSDGFTYSPIQNAPISIPVTTTWLDENGKKQVAAPEEGEVSLYIRKDGGNYVYDMDGDEVSSITLTSPEWTDSFVYLPMYNYDGSLVDYVVELSWSWARGFLNGELRQVDAADVTKGYTYTARKNTAISIPVTARWVDEEGNDVADINENYNVRVRLYRNDSYYVYDVNGNDYNNYRYIYSDDGSWTFDNLPKYDDYGNPIEYGVEIYEENNGSGFLHGEIVQNDPADVSKGFTYSTVQNPVLDIPVTVRWVGSDGVTETVAPSDGYVGFKLTDQKGKAVYDIYGNTVSNIYMKDGVWSGAFTDLYKYNSDGSAITYTVKQSYFRGTDFEEGTLAQNTAGDPFGGYTYTSKTDAAVTLDGVVMVNGQLKRYKAGAVDTAYTGLDKYKTDGQWYYFVKGVHNPSYTGFAKSTDGKWYVAINGRYDKTYTGLAENKVNNGWFYAEKGVYKKGYTGIAKSTDGKLYYVKDSKYNKTYTGLAKYTDGNWYYVAKGVHDSSYTGFAKSTDGKWYYVNNGVWDETYTGFGKSTDGKWYVAINGRYDKTYTGLAENKVNDGWFYAEKGVYKKGYTGIAKSTDGKLYYVKDSKWDKTYTGLAKYTDGKWYYVAKGVHDSSYTGFAKSTDGKWYYVNNGVWDETYTGFGKSTDGKWYVAINGRYDKTYTGLAENKVNDGWFYAEKGVYKKGYTGIAKSTDGKLYYVKDSKWDKSYTGLAKYTDGNWYYVSKGKHVSTFTGVCKSTDGKLYYAKNGVWDKTFTGKAKDASGKEYNVKNGKVV